MIPLVIILLIMTQATLRELKETNKELKTKSHIQMTQNFITYNGHQSIGYSSTIRNIIITKDGKLLSIGSEDCRVRIYNNQHQNFTLIQTLTQSVKAITSQVMNGNSTLLFVTNSIGDVLIYQKQDLLFELIQTINGHHFIYQIGVSDNANVMVTVDVQGTATVYQFNNQTKLYQIIQKLQESKGALESVAISSDGKCLATGSTDQKIRIYNYNQTKYILKQQINDSEGIVISLDMTDNCEWLVGGSQDWSTRVYKFNNTNFILTQSFEDGEEPILHVKISEDGMNILSSDDTNARLYTRKNITFSINHIFEVKTSISSVSFSEDTKYVCIGVEDTSNIYFSCLVDYCQTCQYIGSCQFCLPGFDYRSEDNICKCGSGKTINQSNNGCVWCKPTNCIRCDAENVCALCDHDRTVSQTTGNCALCQSKHCLRCDFDDQCARCQPGRTQSKFTKDCQLCIVDNCARCDQQNLCSQCNSWIYRGEEGICSISWVFIGLICICGLVIILVIVITVIVVKKKRNKTRQQLMNNDSLMSQQKVQVIKLVNNSLIDGQK